MQYHLPNASWPNTDIMKTMPFDYTIHDPKYDDISSVYSPGYKPSTEGTNSFKRTHMQITKHTTTNIFISLFSLKGAFILCSYPVWLCFKGNTVRQEDVYLRRRTSRIKLSKYAAYNTYHHCEQCHQYLGFNPRYQVGRKPETS